MNWLLIFIFSGQVYASGPFELDTCLLMLQDTTKAPSACVRADRPKIRIERSTQ
jgi:hypothetical protein